MGSKNHLYRNCSDKILDVTMPLFCFCVLSKKPFSDAQHQQSSGKCKSNHCELSSHTCQNGYHQKETKQQMLVRMQRKGTLVPCWWERKLV